MNCPKCGNKAYVVTKVRGATTLLGTGAGGYVAATAGAKTGAAVGHLLCPGPGTLIAHSTDKAISNAKMEGFNNKIRRLTRQAYGFRDREYFKLKIYQLPEISCEKAI